MFANRPKQRGSGTRDLGLRGTGAGKGDVTRVSDVEAYRKNFPRKSGVRGLVRKGVRLIKKY